MRGLKRKLITATCLLLAAGFTGAAPALADDLPDAARDGVVYYNEEDYKKAVNKFQEALTEKPNHPQTAYNAGNANYRLGRYEAALEDYDTVINQSTDPDLKQKAWYNKGNAWYKLGALDRAIKAYKKSLELNPEDEDSKFNYEYAQKQLERAIASGQIMPRNLDGMKQQAGQGQAPPSDSESAKGEAAGHGDSTEQPEPDDSQTAEQEKNQPDEQGKDPPEPETLAQPEPAPQEPGEDTMRKLLHEAAPMSREEAERLLGSLNENLKKYKHRQMQGEMKDLFKEQGKDW